MKTYNEKTAILTGITGQDASYLAEYLLGLGYKVIGLQRKTSTFNTERIDHIYNHPNFKAEWGNLTDTYSIWSIINKYKPDEVYHLGALTHVKVSFQVPEEALQTVAAGTLNILNACKELVPHAKIYNAASSELFGDNPECPQNEETRMTPASPYACAKLYAYSLCRNYRKSYGMFISSGILFNHESPRRNETFVTRKITKAAARIKLGLQKELSLGNLDAKRDWGYAKEYVKGIHKILQHHEADDFVLATGETHTVREFLEEVFAHAQLDPYKFVKIDERLFRPQEVPLLQGDPTKAQNALQWRPQTKFKELARLMYEHDLEEQKAEVARLMYEFNLEEPKTNFK